MNWPRWRLIVSGALPGSLNMAMDEVLLETVCQGRSAPAVRFYQWERPTLSLGYAQTLVRSVNVDFCREKGIPLVRRITGGRTVLHHHELTYAVVSPEKNAIFPGGIQGNYLVIAEVLREAFLRFGIAARLASGREKAPPGAEDFRHNVCFYSPSLYELTVAGCKLTGSAQIRREGCFLQHGSLPLEMDNMLLAGALRPPRMTGGANGIDSLNDAIGWINRFAPQKVSVSGLQQTLIDVMGDMWGIRLEEDIFRPEEMEKAFELQRKKYENDAWTLGKRKNFTFSGISGSPR